MQMKTLILTALLALGALAPAAHAADTETTAPANATNADYTAGKQAVERKDWAGAAASFRKVVAAEPNNADGYNMLGFSLRWQGKMEDAFAAYDRALSINPEHRGALEYSGVAYLKAGKPAKAQEQLARLEKLGAKTSEEYRDLAKAIADYTAGKR
jgi:tetratricopeptide (TPR) repeat protein